MNSIKPITVKFGGSSLADVGQFKKVKAIVESDERRRYAVPSAPGKRSDNDIKVTDLLYKCFELSEREENIDATFSEVVARYNGIIDGLGLDMDLSDTYAKIKNAIESHAGSDFAASRGEYLSGMILAKYLGYHFIDAARVIKFKNDGTYDSEATSQLLKAKLAEHKRAVIPGFYGSMPNGTIKTFSRGGSDVTGSIVAAFSDSSVYENWTDVDAFLMTDPHVVKNPKAIETITYRELRELSYMGAGVLHEDAVFPVRAAGIPINIRNTNAPENKGTMIVPRATASSGGVITGIAGKQGFSVISIEKDMFHNEKGIARRTIEIIEKNGMQLEHMPTGIDSLNAIVSGDVTSEIKNKVISEIKKEINPDSVSFESGLALIAVVGRGMVQSRGTAAKIFKACADSGINIRMIDQGSSEINIIIGVADLDFTAACNAIYDEFNTF